MSAKKTSAQDADAGEEAPAWAKSLFSSFQSNQESMTVKLDEICSSIRTLSKDFKAVQHRVANAEKRISNLEEETTRYNPRTKKAGVKMRDTSSCPASGDY